MNNNNWHVPLSKFNDEQRVIIERVYGVRKCYDYLVNCEGRVFLLTDHHPFSSEITPDEAFKILGLDKLLESEQGLQNVDWSLIEHEYNWLVQRKSDGDVDFFEVFPHQDSYTILATRPKPKVKPLTPEQIEAAKDAVMKYQMHVASKVLMNFEELEATHAEQWLIDNGYKQTGGEL